MVTLRGSWSAPGISVGDSASRGCWQCPGSPWSAGEAGAGLTFSPPLGAPDSSQGCGPQPWLHVVLAAVLSAALSTSPAHSPVTGDSETPEVLPAPVCRDWGEKEEPRDPPQALSNLDAALASTEQLE